MSDVDPTPETPTTVGDRLGWFRGDMNGGLANLAAGLLALRGTPETTLQDLAAAIVALRGAGPATVSELLREASFGQAMTTLINVVEDLALDVAALRSAVGVSTSGAEGTVIALLQRIARQSAIAVEGLPPILPDDAVGAFGDTIIEGGRRYAVWTSAPLGTTLSSGGTQVNRAAGLTNYRIYVQTNAPSVYLDGTEAAPNYWHSLTGRTVITASVDWQYNITAYIDPPAPAATAQFTFKQFNNPGGTVNDNAMIWASDLAGVFGVTEQDITVIDTIGGFNYSPNVTVNGNVNGYRFIKAANQFVEIWYDANPNNPGALSQRLALSGTDVTVNINSTSWGVFGTLGESVQIIAP